MLGWFKARRRRHIAERPFPKSWRDVLEQRAPFYTKLSPELRARLEAYVQIFVAEKTFIAAGGLELTDEIRVVIAASAVRLVLRLDIDRYDRLTEIVVCPSAYLRPDEHAVYLGEAHAWGTVVLAWDAVLSGLSKPQDGHDTTLHEMAHVLDRESGAFDGTPTLRARSDYRSWGLILSRHYLRLRENRAPENAVVDGYGSTNEAEFFAVATETFFERPEQLRTRLPALYGELARFYGMSET